MCAKSFAFLHLNLVYFLKDVCMLLVLLTGAVTHACLFCVCIDLHTCKCACVCFPGGYVTL